MEKQVLVNESSLIGIADALRTKLGPTYTDYESDIVFKPTMKISKTSNALSFTEHSGSYSGSASDFDVITIEGANKISATIAYQTESTNYDWVQVAPGTYSAAPSTSVAPKKGGKTLKQETLEFNDTDTITFYFKSDTYDSDYLGYYAEVVGYDSDGNIVGADEEVLIPIEKDNVFTPSAMGAGILKIATGVEVNYTTLKGLITANASYPSTIDLSPYVGTDDKIPFLLVVQLKTASGSSEGTGTVIYYDGNGTTQVIGYTAPTSASDTDLTDLQKYIKVSFSAGIFTLTSLGSTYIRVSKSQHVLIYWKEKKL